MFKLILIAGLVFQASNSLFGDELTTSAEFKKKYNEILARELNSDALDFRLVDQDGSPFSLSGFYDNELIHIVSVHPGCDGINFVKKTKKYFQKKYKKKKTKIIFLNSDVLVSREKIAEAFPRDGILMDEYQQVGNSLSFKRAGDFVTLNPREMKIVDVGNLFELLKLKTNTSSSCQIKYEVYKKENFESEILPAVSRSCIRCHYDEQSLNYFKSLQSIKNWKEMMLKTMRLKRMPPGADPYYGKLVSGHTVEDQLKIVKWLESGVSATEEEEAIYQNYLKKIQEEAKERINKIEGELVTLLEFPNEKVEAFGDSYYKHYFAGPTTEDHYFCSLKVSLNKSVAHHVVLHFLPHKFPAVDLTGKPVEHVHEGYQLYGNFPEPVIGKSVNGKLKGTKFSDPQIIHLAPTNSVQSCPKGGTHFIPKGSYLNYEVHYNPSGVAEESPIKVQIYSNKEQRDLIKMGRFSMTLDAKELVAKANQKDVKISVSYKTKEPYIFSGYGIHTHYRGRSGKLYLKRPNEKKPVVLMSYPTHQYKIKISNYLMNDFYIPKGSTLISEIIYDNSKENLSNPDSSHPVYIGPSILNDENYLPRFYVKEPLK